jgi:hypothetical protein
VKPRLAVRFDQDTNTPVGAVLEKPDVDALFTFSAPFAEKYQGFLVPQSGAKEVALEHSCRIVISSATE